MDDVGDRTDHVVLVWLAVLTVVVGLAFAVAFRRIDDHFSEQQHAQNAQIVINQQQIAVNNRLIRESQAQIGQECRDIQAAWDRSARLVLQIASLGLPIAAALQRQLGSRPRCPA